MAVLDVTVETVIRMPSKLILKSFARAQKVLEMTISSRIRTPLADRLSQDARKAEEAESAGRDSRNGDSHDAGFDSEKSLGRARGQKVLEITIQSETVTSNID